MDALIEASLPPPRALAVAADAPLFIVMNAGSGKHGLYPELLEEREQAKRELGRSRWVAFGAALGTLLRPHRSLSIEVRTKEHQEAK